MTAIITADTHFGDKPADEYRWGLLDQLGDQDADELIICGDLCNDKDRHPSRLVNKLHTAIRRLAARFRIILLKGNHDYIDPNHPFWAFLGNASNALFISEPTLLQFSIGDAFFVPAGSDWNFDIPKVPYLFTHATFNGAKAENGRSLTGVNPRVLDGFNGRVISGDIHVPQNLLGGKITYVGAPYHVRFGDAFEPRILRISDNGKETDLHFPAPRKYTFVIGEPDDLLRMRAAEGDHVKVKCQLRRAEYVKWRDYQEDIRSIAADKGWRLFGAEPVAIGEEFKEQPDKVTSINPGDLLVEYVRREKADARFLAAGRRFLESTK